MPYDPQPYEAINNAVFGGDPSDTLGTSGDYSLSPQDINAKIEEAQQRVYSNPQYQAQLKALEKEQRLAEIAKYKKLKLYGKAPIKYESDGVTPIDDSEAMLWAKQLANAGLGGLDWALEATENVADFGQGNWLDNARFKAEIKGREVDMRNKDFIGASGKTLEDIRNEYQTAKENPMALGGVYTLRKLVGYDEAGNPQYVYKNGYAKDSAWNRYETQGIFDDGWELVNEKRFAGAEDWEKQLNAIMAKNGLNAIDSGMVNVNGELVPRDEAALGTPFGSGKTEISTEDVLGVSQGFTPEIGQQNLARSKAFGEYMREHSRGTANPFKAIGSGTISLAAGLGDALLDALTPGNNTLLDEYKSEKWADKVTGYNRLKGQQLLNESFDLAQKGDVIGAITYGAPAGGLLFAESVPMMALMAVPIPGARAASVVGASTLAKTAASAAAKGLGKDAIEALVSKQAKELALRTGAGSRGAKEILDTYNKYKEYNGLLQGYAHAAKNAGFYANWAQYTNNELDQLAANRREAGQDPTITATDIMRVAAIQLPSLALDRAAFLDIVGGKGAASKLVKQAMKAKDAVVKNGVASKLLEVGARGIKAYGEEAGQEFLQEWGDILSENLGIDGNTLESLVKDPEMMHRAAMAAYGGGAAGLAGHAMTAAPRTAYDIWNKKSGNAGLQKALNAKSYKELADEDILPSDAEAVVAGQFSAADNEKRLNDIDFGNPQVFNDLVDTLTKKRVQYVNEGSPVQVAGYNEMRKQVVDNIIQRAFDAAVEKSKKSQDTKPMETFTKNVAKLIADPNVDLSAKDVESMFADRVAGDITELFTSAATMMEAGVDENGNPVMETDEGFKKKVDKLLAEINLYKKAADEIQGSIIDVKGEPVNVDDTIFQETDALTLDKLATLLRQYRSGKKTIGQVAEEFSQYGYIEEQQRGKNGVGASFVRWMPSIRNYAKELTKIFQDPKQLKNLLNKKVEAGKKVNLSTITRFAKSRLQKLMPYKKENGEIVNKYVTPRLIDAVARENAQLENLVTRLESMLEAGPRAGKQTLTEEERKKIQERLNEAKSYLAESNQRLTEIEAMLVPEIEKALGIKFKVDHPLRDMNIRQYLAGHAIETTMDKDGNVQTSYKIKLRGDKNKIRQKLNTQRNFMISNGYADPSGDMVINDEVFAPDVETEAQPGTSGTDTTAQEYKDTGVTEPADVFRLRKLDEAIKKAKEDIKDEKKKAEVVAKHEATKQKILGKYKKKPGTSGTKTAAETTVTEKEAGDALKRIDAIKKQIERAKAIKDEKKRNEVLTRLNRDLQNAMNTVLKYKKQTEQAPKESTKKTEETTETNEKPTQTTGSKEAKTEETAQKPDALKILEETMRRLENGIENGFDDVVDTLKALRDVLGEYNETDTTPAIRNVASNLRAYIAKVEKKIAEDVVELKKQQNKKKRLKTAGRLVEFVKSAWNKIRMAVKKLLTQKEGAKDIHDRLMALVGKPVPDQMAALNGLIGYAELVQQDINDAGTKLKLDKKRTHAIAQALREYSRIMRRKYPKKKRSAAKKENNWYKGIDPFEDVKTVGEKISDVNDAAYKNDIRKHPLYKEVIEIGRTTYAKDLGKRGGDFGRHVAHGGEVIDTYVKGYEGPRADDIGFTKSDYNDIEKNGLTQENVENVKNAISALQSIPGTDAYVSPYENMEPAEPSQETEKFNDVTPEDIDAELIVPDGSMTNEELQDTIEKSIHNIMWRIDKTIGEC